MTKIKYIKPDGSVVTVKPIKVGWLYGKMLVSPAATDRAMLRKGWKRKNRK